MRLVMVMFRADWRNDSRRVKSSDYWLARSGRKIAWFQMFGIAGDSVATLRHTFLAPTKGTVKVYVWDHTNWGPYPDKVLRVYHSGNPNIEATIGTSRSISTCCHVHINQTGPNLPTGYCSSSG